MLGVSIDLSLGWFLGPFGLNRAQIRASNFRRGIFTGNISFEGSSFIARPVPLTLQSPWPKCLSQCQDPKPVEGYRRLVQDAAFHR